jgi:hypothetical protein
VWGAVSGDKSDWHDAGAFDRMAGLVINFSLISCMIWGLGGKETLVFNFYSIFVVSTFGSDTFFCADYDLTDKAFTFTV